MSQMLSAQHGASAAVESPFSSLRRFDPEIGWEMLAFLKIRVCFFACVRLSAQMIQILRTFGGAERNPSLPPLIRNQRSVNARVLLTTSSCSLGRCSFAFVSFIIPRTYVSEQVSK